VLGALVAAAALGFGGYVLATRGEETTDDAQVEADVVAVAPRVGGMVAEVLVRDNQPVKRGALVFRIDEADYAARLAQAQAELAIAKAQQQTAEAQEQVIGATATGGLKSAKAMVSGSSVAVATAQAQIGAAAAALERAKADAHKADLDLERAKQLLAVHAIPQERLDNAQIARDSAQATLAQAQAALAAAESTRNGAESRVTEAEGRLAQSTPIDAQIAAARAQTELARARVQAATASVTLAQNQLAYTKVTAPADGVISKLTVREGQLVQPSQPAAELVPSRSYVVGNFKETQVGRMRAGDRATIRIDAFPGRKLEGKVESLSGGTGSRFSMMPPDNASGNFVKVVQRIPVRIEWVQAADLPLRAGMSAEVTVEVSGK
jgi:membrane fusion protein (multidrug efflux system)